MGITTFTKQSAQASCQPPPQSTAPFMGHIPRVWRQNPKPQTTRPSPILDRPQRNLLRGHHHKIAGGLVRQVPLSQRELEQPQMLGRLLPIHPLATATERRPTLRRISESWTGKRTGTQLHWGPGCCRFEGVGACARPVVSERAVSECRKGPLVPQAKDKTGRQGPTTAISATQQPKGSPT